MGVRRLVNVNNAMERNVRIVYTLVIDARGLDVMIVYIIIIVTEITATATSHIVRIVTTTKTLMEGVKNVRPISRVLSR